MMADINDVRLLNFPQRSDEHGYLVIVEGEKDIPFSIQRVFYIYGADHDIVRGKHANRKTEFVLVNVAGKSKILVDDGIGHKVEFNLDRPNLGIYLPKMIWKNMYDYSPDSVLLCLASEHYDALEYIRDYQAFTDEVKKGF